eukprot:XP_019071885.1 PREDICTED: uncharacterized protein LOC109121611 [Vitis vinifera]
MEVFMDNINVYGSAFDECLVNLEAMLNRCIEKDLVLNWEKCYFMVPQGIVLGHIISSQGIEVDKAKVELIVKLPSPTTVKGVRQFLGRIGFYKRFIKDFSKLARPLCELLAPTVPSSKGGVPFSPPQRQYLTWRPLTSPPPEPSVHRITPKRARTSGPRETSRQSRPQPQAPAGSQHPSDIAPEAIIKRPMVTVPPIEGNSDCRAKPFHFELYFDIEAMRQ